MFRWVLALMGPLHPVWWFDRRQKWMERRLLEQINRGRITKFHDVR